MNDYGLAVNNSNGDIMFDSRRQMNSYVLQSYGTASSVSVEAGDLVCVQGSTAVASKIIYGLPSIGGTYSFYAYDPTARTTASVSLSYMVVRQSKDVTIPANEDFGLLVRNPDGSTQFDSRTVQSDAHCRITDYFGRLTVPGNAALPASPNLITDTSEYVELTRWTSFASLGNFGSITGAQWLGGNQPKAWSYNWVIDPSLGEIRTYNDVRNVIMIAELDV